MQCQSLKAQSDELACASGSARGSADADVLQVESSKGRWRTAKENAKLREKYAAEYPAKKDELNRKRREEYAAEYQEKKASLKENYQEKKASIKEEYQEKKASIKEKYLQACQKHDLSKLQLDPVFRSFRERFSMSFLT